MRDDWVIYGHAIRPRSEYQSLELIVNPKPLEVAWHQGFYEEERGGELRWRWAAKTAILMITNSTPQPQRLRITMSLATGWSENSNLHIESFPFTTTIPIHSEPELFSAVVTVPAHESVPVRLISEAQRVPAAEDPREMYFRIQDFRFEPLP